MISLQSLSNTPPNRKLRKLKTPIKIQDIEYLDIHADKLNQNDGNKDAVKKANNKKNNDMREELIEFIFRDNEKLKKFLKEEHPYQRRWMHWYNESLKIKKKLQSMYKTETSSNIDGNFHIRQRGGSNYSYDFAVRISSADKTKKTFIPLEYKHQSSLGKLPQFYQVSNVSQPLFEQPYHEYYYNEGLGDVAKLIGINIKLTKDDMKIYSNTIKPCVWSKAKIELVKEGKITKNKNINKILSALRNNYEQFPKGKSESYKKQKKIVSNTIRQYLQLMKSGFINSNLIHKLQEIILTKQKPTDKTYSNGNPKDKIYLLCEFKNGELYWKLDKYAKNDFMLKDSPDEVIVDNENIMFPTKSGKYINLRLRWQNVAGIFNPSWQMSSVPDPEINKAVKSFYNKYKKYVNGKTKTLKKLYSFNKDCEILDYTLKDAKKAIIDASIEVESRKDYIAAKNKEIAKKLKQKTKKTSSKTQRNASRNSSKTQRNASRNSSQNNKKLNTSPISVRKKTRRSTRIKKPPTVYVPQ